MHEAWAICSFPTRLSLPQPLPTTMSDLNPYDLKAKYTRFRILVIGRANAGKTTILQRMCNTISDPCLYDEDKNMVSVHRLEVERRFWRFQPACTYFSGTSLTIDSH